MSSQLRYIPGSSSTRSDQTGDRVRVYPIFNAAAVRRPGTSTSLPEKLNRRQFTAGM
jgi:hypothetical protein